MASDDVKDTQYVVLEGGASSDLPSAHAVATVVHSPIVVPAEAVHDEYAQAPLMEAPRPPPRKDRCCHSCLRCFTRCILITTLIIGAIVALITLCVNTWYGDTTATLQSKPSELEFVIEADAAAILDSGMSMGNVLVRLQNVNNFDVTYKDLNVALKLKQGGTKKDVAKFSSSDSVTIKAGERGNLVAGYRHVMNTTAVRDLGQTCTNKGWSQLKVHGNVHMKGGWNMKWSRQKVKTHFNKCMPCQCDGELYCGASSVCPR
jgi:hypothetical protein